MSALIPRSSKPVAAISVVETPREPTEAELRAAYEAAESHLAAVRAKHHQLRDRIAGGQAAFKLHLVPVTEAEMAATVRLREAAERFLAGRTMAERHIRREIEDLEDEMAVHQPQLLSARQAFERARDALAAHVALKLQPEHRVAVQRLALALQAVSDAVSAEEAVRAKLAATQLAPLGSVLLPDVSSILSLGRFSDPASRLADWRRRAVACGALGR